MSNSHNKGYYTSITGDKILINDDETTFTYSKAQLEYIVNDPLTLEFMKNPVIVNDNVYDLDSIRKWFFESDKDPLMGGVVKNLKVVKYKMLKYVLLCLEEVKDGFVFHSNVLNLLAGIFIAQLCGGDKQFPKAEYSWDLYVHAHAATITGASEQEQEQEQEQEKEKENKNKKSVNKKQISIVRNSFRNKEGAMDISIRGIMKRIEDETIDGLEFNKQRFTLFDFTNIRHKNIVFKNCIFTSCILPLESQMISCTLDTFSDKVRYRLEDMLLVCHVTENSLHKKQVCIMGDGYMLSEEVGKMKTTGYQVNSFEEHMYDVIHCDKIGTKIPKRMYDQLKVKYVICNKNTNGYHLALETVKDEREIDVRTVEESTYMSMLLLKNRVASMKLQKAIGFMSSKIDADNIAAFRDTDLMQLRKFLGIPFLTNQAGNTYGKDLSLMKIQNMVVKKASFKDFYFSGGQIENVEFNGCDFAECCFVGTVLKNVKFVKCSFHSYFRKFYMTVNNGVSFRDCTARDLSYKYLREFIGRTPFVWEIAVA